MNMINPDSQNTCVQDMQGVVYLFLANATKHIDFVVVKDAGVVVAGERVGPRHLADLPAHSRTLRRSREVSEEQGRLVWCGLVYGLLPLVAQRCALDNLHRPNWPVTSNYKQKLVSRFFYNNLRRPKFRPTQKLPY